LLGHDRIPEHALRRLRDRTREEVRELDPRSRADGHLLVAEIHDVARVAEDGGNVGRDEEFAVAKADDNRRAVANRDNLFGGGREGVADAVFDLVWLPRDDVSKLQQLAGASAEPDVGGTDGDDATRVIAPIPGPP